MIQPKKNANEINFNTFWNSYLPVTADHLKLLLSFAVGGLLGDVFLHLLPEAWAHVHEGNIHLLIKWSLLKLDDTSEFSTVLFCKAVTALLVSSALWIARSVFTQWLGHFVIFLCKMHDKYLSSFPLFTEEHELIFQGNAINFCLWSREKQLWLNHTYMF